MKRSLYLKTISIMLLALILGACSEKIERHPAPGKTDVQQSAELTGEALFIERCRYCHMVGDQGGLVGPNLSRIGSIRDRAFLEQAIREPSKLNPGTVMPTYDTFSTRQVGSLVDYLGALKQP